MSLGKTTIQSVDQELSVLLKGLVADAADALGEAACRWEMPKGPAFGDLSNPICFKLAAVRKKSPQAVAVELSEKLQAAVQAGDLAEWIERIEPKSGYMNVFFSQRALTQLLEDVHTGKESFGTCKTERPQKINIEFLSANPTGPLSVAHGRQAAVGDVLARLLRSQGQEVTKEYYLNDEGRQIELLGRSLRLRYRELLGRKEPFLEDGYHGDYVYDVAKDFIRVHGDKYADAPEETSLEVFMQFGMDAMLAGIRKDLEFFGLHFDAWTSQRWVRESGKQDAALDQLRKQGYLYDSEDATWFAATRFGDDKDRVVRKSDGTLTYLAPDIAYHQWKFSRGFDRIVNLWGPDHHGYISRIKASASALGHDPERLDIRIVQLVTLSRGGKPVRMSKRQGEFVTFREILQEVGVAATRFFFLMRTMESHLDFDLDLAKSQSQENPVYYIQYAHARICSILAKSREQTLGDPDLQLLSEEETKLLMRMIFQYPVVLRLSAAAFEPHALTVYLRKLAESFHSFYTKHRVVSDDPVLSATRLYLIEGVRQVLSNGLGLLGIEAPKRM